VIVFGVLPQVITAWIAVVLYRFEVNLRSATVLGMVGAGGLGFELVSSLKLFRYQDTATCIIVITVMVIVADTSPASCARCIQRRQGPIIFTLPFLAKKPMWTSSQPGRCAGRLRLAWRLPAAGQRQARPADRLP
jgi:hypothetical protein